MDATILCLLCLGAFCAGFIDAIVGGGGLVQTPLALLLLPDYAVSVVIGTLKIPAFSGTAIAVGQYAAKGREQIAWRLLAWMMLLAGSAAFCGSWLQTLVPNSFMKPLLVIILFLLLIYTFLRKDFGQQQANKDLPRSGIILYGVGISLVLGLYDGFIGPGAGIFLLLAFITILGYDLLHASATAKMLNLATNFGSICLFLLKGKIVWGIALPMAACNAAGGWLGARLAIRKGNKFIRVFFLVVVLATLLRLGYDVLFHS